MHKAFSTIIFNSIVQNDWFVADMKDNILKLSLLDCSSAWYKLIGPNQKLIKELHFYRQVSLRQ